MTTLEFLNTRRKDLKKDHWLSLLIWYFFLFSLVLIAGVNFTFFLVNWQDLTIIIDDTAIYITFVGFLFAFAGINIYSIFNTNIEEEKKRLSDLYEKYKEEMYRTMDILEYSKKYIKYYQLCQMITNSVKFNAQIGNWLDELDSLARDSSDFLYKLSHIDKEEFGAMSADFTDINRSVYYLLCSFRDALSIKERHFFDEVERGEENEFFAKIDNVITLVNKYQTKDFSEPEIVEENHESKAPSIRDGVKMIWNALLEKFKRNKTR